MKKVYFSLVLFALSFCSFGQVDSLPVSYSTMEYAGPWNDTLAAHLGRRSLLGMTFPQLQSLTAAGNAGNAVDALFTPLGPLNEPLSYHPDEAVVAMGAPWANAVYPATDAGATDNARKRSLEAFMIEYLMTVNTNNIQARMFMFYLNHFAVSACNDQRINYQYYELIHDLALGNFKDLLVQMNVNPNMLLFLNGHQNTGFNPNENYARELLELFSIGKAEQIGVGDYTHYTELDVAEGAKIMSGWVVNDYRSTTVGTPSSSFVTSRHDVTTKTLSDHFGGQTISNNGAMEHEDYINLISADPEFGYFFCEEIYQFFAGRITDTVRQTVITDMRQVLVDNNFEIEPVLKLLLKSEHFYDVRLRGSLMKSPVDFMFSIYNSTNTSANFGLETDYAIYKKMYDRLDTEGQDLMYPPSVAGWPAYYQAPSFDKAWISPVYLKNRFSFSDAYVGGNGFSANGEFLVPDVLYLVDNLSDPYIADSVISDLCLLYYPKSISDTDFQNLKNILTDNLPDFEWTIEYDAYALNPSDPMLQGQIQQRMKAVLKAMTKLYMFHTY